ncbi:MAG TPA: hypothetical protein VJB02_03540 [Coxiellaceae bacterium]|nr:hypothetical protein [Coxiellaceae bacterium]
MGFSFLTQEINFKTGGMVSLSLSFDPRAPLPRPYQFQEVGGRHLILENGLLILELIPSTRRNEYDRGLAYGSFAGIKRFMEAVASQELVALHVFSIEEEFKRARFAKEGCERSLEQEWREEEKAADRPAYSMDFTLDRSEYSLDSLNQFRRYAEARGVYTYSTPAIKEPPYLITHDRGFCYHIREHEGVTYLDLEYFRGDRRILCREVFKAETEGQWRWYQIIDGRQFPTAVVFRATDTAPVFEAVAAHFLGVSASEVGKYAYLPAGTHSTTATAITRSRERAARAMAAANAAVEAALAFAAAPIVLPGRTSRSVVPAAPAVSIAPAARVLAPPLFLVPPPAQAAAAAGAGAPAATRVSVPPLAQAAAAGARAPAAARIPLPSFLIPPFAQAAAGAAAGGAGAAGAGTGARGTPAERRARAQDLGIEGPPPSAFTALNAQRAVDILSRLPGRTDSSPIVPLTREELLRDVVFADTAVLREVFSIGKYSVPPIPRGTLGLYWDEGKGEFVVYIYCPTGAAGTRGGTDIFELSGGSLTWEKVGVIERLAEHLQNLLAAAPRFSKLKLHEAPHFHLLTVDHNLCRLTFKGEQIGELRLLEEASEDESEEASKHESDGKGGRSAPPPPGPLFF